MVTTIVKALILFWPFFKSMIFKDRPVKEVLRVNRQFSILGAITLVLIVILLVVTIALSNTQSELTVARQQLEGAKIALNNVKDRYTNDIGGLVVDPVSGELQCSTVSSFDKQRIINRLRQYERERELGTDR